MRSGALLELKDALERRFPDAVPLGRGTAPSVATGLAALDGMLPGGGLARSRLTVWQPGGGATAVLRAACEAACGRGERAAWIDGAGVQAADGWRSGPVLVRPSSRAAVLEATEALVRSGGFGVVVVTGAARECGREAVRLSRAARAGGTALVVVTGQSVVAPLRVRSQLRPEAYRWRHNPFGEPVEVMAVRVEVEASALGWSGRCTFELPVRAHGGRLAPDPRLADRRGAAKQKLLRPQAPEKALKPQAPRWGRRARPPC